MAQTAPDLQVLSSQAGIALKQRGLGRSGDDLGWAWRHLGAAAVGRTIVEQLAAGATDRQLESVLGHPWETLEVIAMSLGFGNVMSGLDLCADAVLIIGGAPAVKPKGPLGGFYDLGDLRALRRTFSASPAVEKWGDRLLAHQDLKLLKTCRDALTHRQVRQHPGVHWENGRAIRTLAEITPLDSRGVVRSLGSIGELVPRLVAFGEEQLEGLCRAILT